MLALILPVLGATIDGFARARRRGHPIARWVVWVLAAALPFVLAAGDRARGQADRRPRRRRRPARSAPAPSRCTERASRCSSCSPWSLVLSFWLLRPLCLRLAARSAEPAAAGGDPPARAPAPAVLLVICVAALVIWVANPFAALLVVPALHLWMWVVDPDVRIRAQPGGGADPVGLAPPALVVVYYAHSLGLGAVDLSGRRAADRRGRSSACWPRWSGAWCSAAWPASR